MADEEVPGLAWSEDSYEFLLPIGTSGSATPQTLGAVSAVETVLGTPRRRVLYALESASRSGVSVSTTTGDIVYTGPPVLASDTDINLVITASVPAAGRLPAMSISTRVLIRVNRRTTDISTFRVRVLDGNHEREPTRPAANVQWQSGAWFSLQGVPVGMTPVVNISDIAGSNDVISGVAAGSITAYSVPDVAGLPTYGVAFQSPSASRLGEYLTFTVRASVGSQTATADLLIEFKPASRFDARTYINLSSTTGFELSSDNYLNAIGENYTFRWTLTLSLIHI